MNAHSTNFFDDDSLVVDCVAYAASMEALGVGIDTEEYLMLDSVPGVAEVCAGRESKECSITMCGMDGPLLRLCGNGHYIHSTCFENMCYNSSSIDVITCPQCRENKLVSKIMRAMPISCTMIVDEVAARVEEMVDDAIKNQSYTLL
jgi:hypothetical protein